MFYPMKILERVYLMKILDPLLHLTLELNYFGTKIRVKLNGTCLKQNRITYRKLLFGAVMILIWTNILYMVSDLIEKEIFQ